MLTGLKRSHRNKRKKGNCEVMLVLFKLIVVAVSQHISLSNHHFKYIQFCQLDLKKAEEKRNIKCKKRIMGEVFKTY